MASLCELLCHDSLTCSNPLLEELPAYLSIRFPSLIFDYIVYECSDKESVKSIDSSISVFTLIIQVTFLNLSKSLLFLPLSSLCNPRSFFSTQQALHAIEKGKQRRRPVAGSRPKGLLFFYEAASLRYFY